MIFRKSKHLLISGNYTLRTYLQKMSNSAALHQFIQAKMENKIISVAAFPVLLLVRMIIPRSPGITSTKSSLLGN